VPAVEPRLIEKLVELAHALYSEHERAIKSQLLITDLDRKVFDMSVILDFNERIRHLNDPAQLLSEFLNLLIEKYCLIGGTYDRTDIGADKAPFMARFPTIARAQFRHVSAFRNHLRQFIAATPIDEIVQTAHAPAAIADYLQTELKQPLGGLILVPVKCRHEDEGQEQTQEYGHIVLMLSPNFDLTREDLSLLKMLTDQLVGHIKTCELRLQSITDEMTGLFNHRYMLACLDLETQRSLKNGKPMSVLLIDIDHFKKFNDTFGHQTGDFILRGVADRLKVALRSSDLCFRYGGEEFVVLLPDTTSESALVCAERIRESIGLKPFERESQTYTVTVSIGIAATPLAPLKTEDIIRCADNCLYFAKNRGRNRSVLYERERQVS
jgi:diguanylate cyclase (GGDEF)-like protein